MQLLGNFNKIKNRKTNPLLVNSYEKEIRLTFVLLIFSNLMTMIIFCLLHGATLFSTNWKNYVTFHKSTYLHNFDISVALTNSKT